MPRKHTTNCECLHCGTSYPRPAYVVSLTVDTSAMPPLAPPAGAERRAALSYGPIAALSPPASQSCILATVSRNSNSNFAAGSDASASPTTIRSRIKDGVGIPFCRDRVTNMRLLRVCVCPCVYSTYDPSYRLDDLVWSSTWKPSST